VDRKLDNIGLDCVITHNYNEGFHNCQIAMVINRFNLAFETPKRNTNDKAFLSL